MLKLIHDSLDSPQIQVMCNDDGTMLRNTICPVHCGECCTGWAALPEFSTYPNRLGKCPHIGKKGCKLKRSRRPTICNDYLCELGYLALVGQVTDVEVQRVLDAEMQQHAFAFLGVSFPQEEGDFGAMLGDAVELVAKYGRK